MHPDQAAFLRDHYLAMGEDEARATRRVLAAVPEDQGGYAPHPASRTALDLAWHIASSQVWFYVGVAEGAFPEEDGARPEAIRTPADVLAWYDANRPPAAARLKALTGEQLCRPLDEIGRASCRERV